MTNEREESDNPFMNWLDLIEQKFDNNVAKASALVNGGSMTEPTGAQLKTYLNKMVEAFVQVAHKAESLSKLNTELQAEVTNLKNQSIEPNNNVEQGRERLENLYVATVARNVHLQQENAELSKELVQRQCEIGAFRLIVRYADRERAGRVQQLQLVSKNNSPLTSIERDRIAQHLESEIGLHRLKTTVARFLLRNNDNKSARKNETRPHLGQVRHVTFSMKPGEQLQIVLCGGRRNLLPVIVAAVDEKSPLHGLAFAGDVILSANGVDLSQSYLAEASDAILRGKNGKKDNLKLVVRYLGAHNGDCNNNNEDDGLDPQGGDATFLQCERDFITSLKQSQHCISWAGSENGDDCFFFPIELPSISKPLTSRGVSGSLLRSGTFMPVLSCLANSIDDDSEAFDATNPFYNGSPDPTNPFGESYDEDRATTLRSSQVTTKSATVQPESKASNDTGAVGAFSAEVSSS